MTFAVEQSDPTVITLSGNVLGGAEAMSFTGVVADLVRAGVRYVIADLSDVPLMNSSGLGMLVGASTTLRNAGGVLAVAGANEKLRELFRMTRLDAVLALYATRADAAAAAPSR